MINVTPNPKLKWSCYQAESAKHAMAQFVDTTYQNIYYQRWGPQAQSQIWPYKLYVNFWFEITHRIWWFWSTPYTSYCKYLLPSCCYAWTPPFSEYKFLHSVHNSDEPTPPSNKFLYKMQLKCNNMTEITVEELPVGPALYCVLLRFSIVLCARLDIKFSLKCIVFYTHVSYTHFSKKWKICMEFLWEYPRNFLISNK